MFIEGYGKITRKTGRENCAAATEIYIPASSAMIRSTDVGNFSTLREPCWRNHTTESDLAIFSTAMEHTPIQRKLALSTQVFVARIVAMGGGRCSSRTEASTWGISETRSVRGLEFLFTATECVTRDAFWTADITGKEFSLLPAKSIKVISGRAKKVLGRLTLRMAVHTKESGRQER